MKKSGLIFTTLLAFAKACFYYPPLSDYKRLDLLGTVFENHRKSLIQHCKQSYVYIMSRQKFIKNTKIGQFWRVFENLKFAVKQCYQIGHFWWKTPKIEKFICDILSDFQTLCFRRPKV